VLVTPHSVSGRRAFTDLVVGTLEDEADVKVRVLRLDEHVLEAVSRLELTFDLYDDPVW
jgi:hypothetical protein